MTEKFPNQVAQRKQRQNHLHSKKARAGPTSTDPIHIFEQFTLKLEEEFGSLTNDFSSGWISREKLEFSRGKRCEGEEEQRKPGWNR